MPRGCGAGDFAFVNDPVLPAWQYDPDYIYVDPTVAFSVFNSI